MVQSLLMGKQEVVKPSLWVDQVIIKKGKASYLFIFRILATERYYSKSPICKLFTSFMFYCFIKSLFLMKSKEELIWNIKCRFHIWKYTMSKHMIFLTKDILINQSKIGIKWINNSFNKYERLKFNII